MKSFLFFVGGFLAGIVVAFALINSKSTIVEYKDYESGLTRFTESGECIPSKNGLQILQVIEPGMALAETGSYPDRLTLLLIDQEGKSFYDDQKIKIPPKKCARHIGTYRYRTRLGIDKTVPAVAIE